MRTERLMKTLVKACCIAVLVMTIISIRGGALAETAGTNELDGSKIEGVSLEWVTQDSTRTAEGEATSSAELADTAHLYLATTSASELRMVYKITVQLSGQYDYAPGDITITIPAQVWHARKYVTVEGTDRTVGVVDDEKYIGTLELGVPAYPSKKADFNYQLIDGEYVLTNTRTISAASSVTVEAAICGLYPMDVVDMSQCDDIVAHVEVLTNQGNIIQLDSTPINAQIDTQARVSNAVKTGTLYESYADTNVPSRLLANLPEGTAPEDYIYVRWATYQSHNNNQPYSLDIADTLSRAYEYVTKEDGQKEKQYITDGIFLGSTNYAGTLLEDGDVDFTAAIASRLTDTSTTYAYDKTVYMWSAYKKADFYVPKATEPERTYYIENAVDWMLTESDGAVDTDPQKVTTKTATATVTYEPIQWARPIGRFAVNKWTKTTGKKDYLYGFALNQLQLGQEAEINFVVETVGKGWLWTSTSTGDYSSASLMGDGTVEEMESLDGEIFDLNTFGKLGWRQITYDFETFFNMENTQLTSEDFQFVSLRVGVPSRYRYDKTTSGQWGYVLDGTLPIPDLLIEYQLNGEDTWYTAATATWGETGNGTFEFVDVNTAAGVTVSAANKTVYFPDNVTDVRHSFISNVYGGAAAEQCNTAEIDWYVYPTIALKPSARVQGIVADLFELSDTPSTKFKNDAKMEVYGWLESGETVNESKLVLRWDFDYSRATLSGAGYGVSLTKTGTVKENDTENRRVVLNYTAKLVERSNLTDRSDYNEAVALGVIPAETSGIWYDLLPEGVAPLLDTVQLRKQDSITAVYTIENYKNTGRTLLVVEAQLTPVIGKVDDYYADTLTLSFDAVYDWTSMDELGTNLVNYVVFESTVDNLYKNTLGTIENQQGEPDNPNGGNNYATPSMSADILAALTDLDPSTDEARFVYAKVDHNISVVRYAVSGLEKQVKSDLVGIWTQGLDEQEQVTVYEGHAYTYRLRVSSAANTATKGIVIYDSIENYIIPDPEAEENQDATKAADYAHTQERTDWTGTWEGKGQWRGTLVQVDLSELVAAGVKPVLVYATIPGLQFADSQSESVDENFDEDTELFASGHYDISDRTVWTVAQVDASGIWTVPEGVNVSAVAIDASKTATGEDFVLMPEESLSAYLKMRAPDDDGNSDTWNAKGAYARLTDEDGQLILDEDGNQQVDWEAAMDATNNMYAYNNVRLRLIQGSVDGGNVSWLSHYRMIRNDYTRVGILPQVLEVQKKWADQDNHDGLRPDSVTVQLWRRLAAVASDLEPVLDAEGQQITATLSEDNDWKATFLQMDIVNDDGLRYLYTFEEEAVEGYKGQSTFADMTHYTLVNTHANETLRLTGTKTWDDDEDAAGDRSEAVKLSLYRDDTLIATKIVTSGADGGWAYDFGTLEKYEQGGRAYVYHVEEEAYVPKYVSSTDGGLQVTNTYYPYGNLEISKTLQSATTAAADKAFTFTLVLLAEQTEGDGEAVPLADKYAYTLYEYAEDAWGQVSSGIIGNGDTFSLKANQKLCVLDLPSESTYQVTEAPVAGFTSAATNAQGTIRAGETAEAAFVNTYASSGGVNLSLGKTLTGHTMNKSQFSFELVDMNEGSDTYGTVLRMARVNAPDETTGGSGEDIQATAQAIFGQLTYTHADDGKTFTYQIREVDNGRSGYTADTTTYTVSVQVADKGDGTMAITPRFYTAEGAPVGEATFENKYKATGSLTLKAWKILNGRDLADEEFTFGLYAYSESGIKRLQTAKNDAEGNIVFADLTFDQASLTTDKNAPMTYTYLVLEDTGTDETVVYSTQAFLIAVTVLDNGDGTLSFTQTTQEGTYANGAWAATGTVAAPVFVNGLQDGTLAIAKAVEGDGSSNGQQAFTFHVQLQGTSVDTIEYNLLTPEPTATPVPSDSSTATTGKTPNTPAPTKEPAPTKQPSPTASTAYHATDADLQGDALAVLNMTTCEFVFFRATANTDGSYTYNGAASGNTNVIFTFSANSNTATFGNYYVFFRDFENMTPQSEGDWPWNNNNNSYRTSIKSVTMEGAVKPVSTAYMFSSIINLTTLDLSKLDTSQVTSMSYMFQNCFILPTPDLSTFDTSQVTDMSFMFLNCFKLTTLDLSTFDTGKVTDMRNMFCVCSGLTTLDLSTFNTSQVTDMSYMFYGCSSLTTLDLSTFDTSQVTSMQGMFRECSSLPTLDLSTFDTSKVTSMNYMFYGCSSLTTLDLSTFDTSKVTSMSYMFCNCSKLTTLDLSTFDTSKVTSMSYMFSGCSSLPTLDLSTFNTSQVTSMYQMFYNCSSLPTLDLSTFDTSQVTNMQGMFSGCSSLTTLDLSTFDTSKVTTMRAMFSYCSSLTALDVSSFNTSQVTTMYQMFNNCSHLAALDLSMFDTSQVKSMYQMFYYCQRLATLDISSFDTSKVTNMDSMFANCGKLVIIAIGDSTKLTTSYPQSGTTLWVREADGTELQGSALFPTGDNAGTWHVATAMYKLSFAPGDGTGSMPDAWVLVDEDYSFTHSFYRYGYKVVAFVDEDGRSYPCTNGKTTIPADTYAAKAAITLTAQWEVGGTAVTVTNGAFDLVLKAGEKADFALPGGTDYTVWEETPTGWLLVKATNAAGTVQPLETATATFTNTYSPNKASAVLHATKLLDGAPARAGLFSFQLLNDDGTTLQTVTNTAGGVVVFEPITYEAAGTYTYTIREVAGEDETITYDATTYTATVTVVDDGEGVLSATVAYSSTPVFRNTTKPGTLEISKVIEGATAAAQGQAFTVQVTFATDAAGTPWSDSLLVDGTETTVANGVLTLSICGGETVRITNVPAGLFYTVAETDLPTGWSQQDVDGGEGTIQPNETHTTTLTNTYAASGTASIGITKELVGRALVEDAFVFTLVDDDGHTYTATNAADGSVTFDELTFTQEGTYTYTIAEIAGVDGDILYSGQQVKVYVTVVDEGGTGTLTSRIHYAADTLTNAVKTGTLEISKLVEDGSSDPEQEFTFYVQLENTNVDVVALGKAPSGEATDKPETAAVPYHATADELAGDALAVLNKTTGKMVFFRATTNIDGSYTYSGTASDGADVTVAFTGTDSSATSEDGTYVFFRNFENPTPTDYSSWPWYNDRAKIKSVATEGAVKPKNAAYMFYGCSNLATVDLSKLDTSAAADMQSVFYNCYSLSALDLSTFDTSKVTDMNNMFYNCYGLSALDVGMFNTSQVTDMHYMFYNCSKLTSLDLSSFNTSQVASMLNMFRYCSSLTALDLSTFDTSKVTNMKYMLSNCYRLATVSLGRNTKLTAYPQGADTTWVNAATAAQKTGAELFPTGGNAGTWRVASVYTLAFDGNGGSGSMPTVYILPNRDYSFTGGFSRYGYRLTGFVDDEGNTYGASDIIAANTYAAGDVITLTAQWALEDGFVPVTDGGFYVTLKAGEKASFVLHAGTAYTVTEVDVPSGWELVSSTGTTGTIATGVTSTATFTNAYAAEGTYTLTATKTLTGRDMEEGEFTFLMVDAEGNQVATGTNDAAGNVTFDTLLFTNKDVGEQVYTITEANTKATGVTYDTTAHTLTLTIADNADGTLTITDDLAGEPIAFANTYTDTTAIAVQKVWDDDDNALGIRPGSITLELYRDRVKVATATVTAADGWQYTFDALPLFNQQGDAYTYNVQEVEVPGYAASTTATSGGYTITNRILGAMQVSKTVEHGDMEKDFTFTVTLTRNGEPLAETILLKQGDTTTAVTPNASGEVSFTLAHGETMQLYGLPVGTAYTVTEAAAPGYTTSAENATGAVQRGNVQAVSFTNTYAATGILELTATKTVNGSTPTAEETFTFVLADSEGTVLQTAKNQGASIAFAPLAYTQADAGSSFVYQVYEQQTDRPGYTLDGTQYTVAVWVADNGDGTLKITKAITNGTKAVIEMAFANTYAATGTLELTATKTVNGIAPTAQQQYRFALTDAQHHAVQATNVGGEIAFLLQYTLADAGKTFAYTLQEITSPTDLLVTDPTIYTVDVTVADNRNGTLTVTPAITAAGEAVEEIAFHNTLYAPLTISKTVDGCETAEAFTFTVHLYDANGQEATGTYAYTGDKAGTLASGDTISLSHGQSITVLALPGMGYTVEEAAQTAFSTTVNGAPTTLAQGTLAEGGSEAAFINTLKTTTFTVTKRWEGGGGGAIVLTLYADGEKLSPQPEYTRDGNVYTYADLPMYNAQGEPIVYSAKERYMDGFTTIYSNVAPYASKTKAIYDGGTIINKAIITPDFAVKKVWTGLADGEDAPAITLVLYCNGEPVDVATPTPDSSGWYKYYDLPATVNGAPAVYTVQEVALSGYTASYALADGTAADHADNGGTITNAKVPQTGDGTPLALWLTLLGACAIALALRRRREQP